MNVHAAISVPLDYARIEQGVFARQVQEMMREGAISREDVYSAVPERTFKRRLAENAKFTLSEADSIARLLRVNGLARWAFGDDGQAQQFLGLPNPELAGRVPRLMARTDAGAREVEAVLFRFAAGDYA